LEGNDQRDGRGTSSQVNIWMMPLDLGKFSDLVCKIQGLAKILELNSFSRWCVSTIFKSVPNWLCSSSSYLPY